MSKDFKERIARWEKKRQSPRYYVFLYGFLIFAFPVSTFIELVNANFQMSELNALRWFFFLLTHSLFGCLVAFFDFKRKDKEYLEFKNKQK